MDEILIKKFVFCIKENVITLDNIVDEAVREQVKAALNMQ